MNHPAEGPNSMHAFISGDREAAERDPIHKSTNTQNHKSKLTHTYIGTNSHQNSRPKEDDGSDVMGSHPPAPAEQTLTRLHVQIRKDLADQLLERLFQLKRSLNHPNKNATQRAIIEAALEAYFERQPKDTHNKSIDLDCE